MVVISQETHFLHEVEFLRTMWLLCLFILLVFQTIFCFLWEFENSGVQLYSLSEQAMRAVDTGSTMVYRLSLCLNLVIYEASTQISRLGWEDSPSQSLSPAFILLVPICSTRQTALGNVGLCLKTQLSNPSNNNNNNNNRLYSSS